MRQADIQQTAILEMDKQLLRQIAADEASTSADRTQGDGSDIIDYEQNAGHQIAIDGTAID